MSRNLKIIIAVVGLAVILPVAYWLVSPLFRSEAVDEDFPGGKTQAEFEATTQAVSGETRQMDEAMPGSVADASILLSGEFYDVAHEGEGKATVYQLADGARALRFEDFSVLNGPDLHVYLVPVDPVPNAFGTPIEGYHDLGRLKGNVGNQNYDIPADLDLSPFKSVVIWCEPFSVPFAAAALK